MSMGCDGGRFSLSSVWATPAWNNSLVVTIESYADGMLKESITEVMGDTMTPIYFDFSGMPGFQNVDNVTVSSDPTHLAIDDLMIDILSPCNVIPQEPYEVDPSVSMLYPGK